MGVGGGCHEVDVEKYRREEGGMGGGGCHGVEVQRREVQEGRRGMRGDGGGGQEEDVMEWMWRGERKVQRCIDWLAGTESHCREQGIPY